MNPLPTIDYTQFLSDLAAAAAKRAVETARPEWLLNNPEFEAQKREESLNFYRENFAEWQALGNHYADVLEDKATPAALHNAIAETVEAVIEDARLHTASPDVLRLLYPLLCFRARERTFLTSMVLRAKSDQPEARPERHDLEKTYEELHIALTEHCGLTNAKGGAVLFAMSALTADSLHERALALMWLLHIIEHVSDPRERFLAAFYAKAQAGIYLANADKFFHALLTHLEQH